MNINFTKRQFKALLELAKFNKEILLDEKNNDLKEYHSLIQYILTFENLHKSLNQAGNDAKEEEDLKEDRLISYREAMEEEIFWRGLCKRIAAEKLCDEYPEINIENCIEYENKKNTMEKMLLKSFTSQEIGIETKEGNDE